jgi:hypothetical protein
MLVEFSLSTAVLVTMLSPIMMRYGSRRPVNGEEKFVIKLERSTAHLKARVDAKCRACKIYVA